MEDLLLLFETDMILRYKNSWTFTDNLSPI